MNLSVVDTALFILMLMSALTWSVIVYKFRATRAELIQSKDFIYQFWSATEWQDVKKLTESSNSDFAKLAKSGFDEYAEFKLNPNSLKYSGDIHDVLERPIRQELQNIMRRQEKGLAELATIGSTAPFVGLFGTVWGIMSALHTISASGNASIDVVAGPIGEALIATAIGIATALPAVIAYNYFLRKIKVLATELENFAEDFVRLAIKNFTK